MKLQHPLLTQEFRLPELYGVKVPDLLVRCEILRDISPYGDVSLPDEYNDEDSLGYALGEWEYVTVRVTFLGITGLAVARTEADHLEFGKMSDGFVNPIGNPDDYPMRNLVEDAVHEYESREGLPL